VALSRCTSLEGIVLLSKIPATAISTNEHVTKGQQLLTPRGSMEERFAGARQAFTREILDDIFSFNDSGEAIDKLQHQILQHRDRLNNGSVEWINALKAGFVDEKNVGIRFISSIAAFLREEPVVENNGHLQKRISDAANHFLPRFLALQQSVQNHPLVTEHKETAAAVNEPLHQLFIAVYTTAYFLQYCKQPFSLPGFLKHKLNFSLPRVSITAYAGGKNLVYDGIPNPELFDTLKRWRDQVIKESGLPIYLVANQTTLKEICTYLPMNKNELMLMPGFGKSKTEKYGDEILEAVESYCSRYGIESNMPAKANSPKRVRKEKKSETKPDTKKLSFDLFRAGKGIEEIAQERKLSIATIEGHLAHFIGIGDLDITLFVSPERQGIIKNALEKFGSDSHRVLLDNLPPGYRYGEIKMVVASLNKK
jgi:hypothetical protein